MSSPADAPRVPALRTRIAAGVLDFLLVLFGALFLSRGFLVFPLLFVGYHTVSLWLIQQTPGKALFGLRVRRCGSAPTLLWALGRSSLGLFLVNGMGLGFVVALFSRRRRAVHDYVFGSMVVLEEKQLGLKLSARLKEWLRQKNETYAKKTELFAIATGIWNFIKWILKQVEWVAGQFEKLIAFFQGGAEAAVATSVPAATSLATASIIGVVSTAVTATIIVAVPGTLEVAGFIASPVYRLTRPADEAGIVATVQGPGAVTTHHAIGGSPVLVKAVLNTPPGETFQYTLDFGDGADPVTREVTGLAFVSEPHQYPEDDGRTAYVARIRVTDSDGEEMGVGEYSVEFVEATDEERIVKALDDALWALNMSQQRESPPDSGSIGYWQLPRPIAATALAALAFEVNGFDSSAGSANPYRETVDRALRYLLSQCKTTPLGGRDPDTNGNGTGITLVDYAHEFYELPMVVMALVASGDPDRIAEGGMDGIRGRRYSEIVADMVDYLASAQNYGQTDYRGGWHYNNTDYRDTADLSVTQWPVLALMAAEEEWDIEVPGWVKSELREHFLAAIQNPDTGQFRYQPNNGATGVGMTGAGLIALNFVDVPASDDRVQMAISYMADNWDSGNFSDYYYMYAVMKAAKLHGVDEFGEHDWLAEYAENLIGEQHEQGTWPSRGYGSGTLATAWPALILSRDIFATGVETRLRRWIADAF